MLRTSDRHGELNYETSNAHVARHAHCPGRPIELYIGRAGPVLGWSMNRAMEYKRIEQVAQNHMSSIIVVLSSFHGLILWPHEGVSFMTR